LNLKVEESTTEIEITTTEINDLIVDAIQDIKGQNIVKIDLSQIEDAPANFFIICEGESFSIQKLVRSMISKTCGVMDNSPNTKTSKQHIYDQTIYIVLRTVAVLINNKRDSILYGRQ